MSWFRGNTSRSDKPSAILRPVAPQEAYQAAAHLLGQYYAACVTCRYTTPTRLTAEKASSSLEDVFEQALALTILEHSMLQVGLINEDSKKPSFVRLDFLDFRNHVTWRTVDGASTTQDDLLSVLHEQHDKPFEKLDQQPLWRVVLLRDSANRSINVLFVWNHTMADGMSGKIFHQTLQEKLNLLFSSELPVIPLEDHKLKLPEASKVSPTLADLVNIQLSAKFMTSELWKDVRPSFLNTEAQYKPKWAPIKRQPNKTRLQLVSSDADGLRAILLKCKQNGTTLTVLLNVLALASFSMRLQPEQAPAFESGTVIDMRRFMTSLPPNHQGLEPHRTMGNYLGYHQHKFTIELLAQVRAECDRAKSSSSNPEAANKLEQSLWRIARELTKGINAKMESGMKDDMMALLKFVPDWRKYFDEAITKPRHISFELSNLGVLDGAPTTTDKQLVEQESWTIDQAIFTQSASVHGPAYIINPMSVKGGSLIISCTWQDEIIEESVAVGVTNDLQTWLDDLGGDRPLSIEKA
ncbi:hypothetical protein PFICI_14317 [Pestalotiopsis fici W106-1]|uniref:Condensation domain-containing protein n=1 Tax=Pestalotiopsis fici (strain W106-1 / CGMCC3.15140) TaxID=1229662 RepID=W3WNP8_PESFW|nr:uncharacterized protein PFICI_14317 [Pestalotiopsis fici W106-1]ETS74451.1 hypothetical protein PFICI_14317 [Pestalotiopsis fici W106-1]